VKLPERYGSWQTVYSRFRKWIEDGTLDNIFRVLSLEAELTELSIDASIVKTHQHSAGAKKGATKRNRTQPWWSQHKNPCSCRCIRLSGLMKILIHRSVYGLVDEFFYVIENYFVMFLLHKKRSARMRPDA